MKNIRNTKIATLILLVALTLPSCTTSTLEKGIGLQLWSLDKDMANDPVTTIQKVGEMGYDFIEAAGYENGKFYATDPVVFKTIIEENGLKFTGSHAGEAIPDSLGWETLMPWWDECIAAHKAVGVEYIVQPWMGKSAYESLEGLAEYCEYFNAVGEKCNAAGIRFGYHNHNKEFQEIEGQRIYDYMLENTDPEKVSFQLDIYWIIEGGGDPAAYVEKYPERFFSFHLKDAKELGESGDIDFMEIYELQKAANIKYNVVEVERYNFEPLVSVEMSLDHLNKIGYGK